MLSFARRARISQLSFHARLSRDTCPILPPQRLLSTLSKATRGLSSAISYQTRWVCWRICSAQARRKSSAVSTAQLEDTYDAAQIQVLEGLEPVRKRPGMYIGSTGQRGLHHLVYEVLDNAIDEVQGGHATTVEVEVDLSSGWVCVTDNGRGIPTSIHPRTGKSALETVLTVLHAGGKFGGEASGYSVSGGLHGVGVSVVNALSEELEVRVWRGGKEHSQSYRRGDPVTALAVAELPTEMASRRGTEVRFLYDRTIFAAGVEFDTDTLMARMRELAFLNSAVTIRFRALKPGSKGANGTAAGSNGHSSSGNELNGNGSAANGQGSGDGWTTFHYDGGLAEYVQWLNRDKSALHEPLFVGRSVEGVRVEAALQWCSDSFSDTVVGFANSVKTVDGGTHLDGFRAALTRTINAVAKKCKLLKEGEPNLLGEHLREGLGAVVSVKVPQPEFEGQTKTRLGNPEVRKLVESVVAQDVGEWLEMHPEALATIYSKGVQAAKAAEAAKKAREMVRRKNALTRSTLPGKLADCTSSNRDETELFVVEGDSAGGSAKQARDRRFQAVLPLRGKILNVERKDDAALYKNNEIAALIVALGLGAKGNTGDLSGLRYSKLVILTDADVDGAHIRTLLLTFLFRYCPQLFEAGHVHAAVPPLYRLEAGRKTTYCYSEPELQTALAGLGGQNFSVSRFKGLGEMQPEQLWDTTLNPSHRLLRRLTVGDAAKASHLFTVLMGSNVAPRRQWIEEAGSRIKLRELDV